MWLTLYFPDLCIYVYTVTPHPPVALAYPCLTAQLRTSCNVMAHGEGKHHVNIHHVIQSMWDINGLLVFDNCYAISCHYL